MSRVFISMGGPDRVIFDESGKQWNFEMHPYSGPATTTKSGDICKNQPGEKSSFWRVTSWWAQQGSVIVDGLCIWRKPPAPKLIHLGGKHYKVAP